MQAVQVGRGWGALRRCSWAVDQFSCSAVK